MPAPTNTSPQGKQPVANTSANDTAAPQATPSTSRPANPRPSAPKPKVAVTGRRHGHGSGTHRDADDQRNFKQARSGAFFIGIVCIVYVLYLVLSGQMGTFLTAMAGVDVWWILAGCLSYVIYYLFGVSAYVLAVVGNPKSPVGVRDLMSVEATGIFFSNLTPNGVGGAPAQIVRLVSTGLSVGDAGALQYTRFVIYEFSEALFAGIMLALRLEYFIQVYGNIVLVGVFLFGFKVIEMIAILSVCLFPQVVTKLGNRIIEWVNKKGWLHRYDYWHDLANNQVARFAGGFRSAAKNWRQMLLTLLVTMVQLAFIYALPWFVLNAFGRPSDLVTCIAAGSMLELLTSAIPLPGGTGGAEGGFAVLFAPLFGETATAGYVIWRAVEYFIPVIAAMPLLSLKSTSGESINHRYRRYKARIEGDGRSAGGHKSQRRNASVKLRK